MPIYASPPATPAAAASAVRGLHAPGSGGGSCTGGAPRHVVEAVLSGARGAEAWLLAAASACAAASLGQAWALPLAPLAAPAGAAVPLAAAWALAFAGQRALWGAWHEQRDAAAVAPPRYVE